MRWQLLNGKTVNHSDNKYRIDWDKPAASKGAQEMQDFFRIIRPHDVWFAEYRVPASLLRVDYLNATLKLAIEFQGSQHFNYSKHFHGSRAGFLASIKRDVRKMEILELNGYKVIEIDSKDLPLTKNSFLEKFGILL